MFDRDRPETQRAVDHEVDLGPGLRAPEVKAMGGIRVVDPRPQVLRDEVLEGGAGDLFAPIERAGRPAGRIDRYTPASNQ